MWQVIFTDEFDDWFLSLETDEQNSILHSVNVLAIKGPMLGRPYVDTLKGTTVSNLKELRVQHQGKPYRLMFVFDPLRQAVMLCGGDKTGNKRFYETFIPLAENIYQRYLQSGEYLNLCKQQEMNNENT